MSELKSADAAKVRTSADIVSRDGEAAASAFVSKRIMSLATSPTLAPDELANGVGALIIGGAHGSLAVARSLGRHRIPVWFLTHEQLIPRFSRYTRRTLQWPGPEHQDAAAYLLELADRHHLAGWVLLPGGDAEAKFIAQNHAALSLKFKVDDGPVQSIPLAVGKPTEPQPRSMHNRYVWSISKLTPVSPAQPTLEGSNLEYWLQVQDNNNVTGPGIGSSDHFVARVVSEAEKRAEILARLGTSIQDVQRGMDDQDELRSKLGNLILERKPE